MKKIQLVLIVVALVINFCIPQTNAGPLQDLIQFLAPQPNAQHKEIAAGPMPAAQHKELPAGSILPDAQHKELPNGAIQPDAQHKEIAQ